jgi:hypothetical protein
MMDQKSPRSLKHDYDLFVENEIDNYKESISRTSLLKIGDEAVAALASQAQFAMSELLLCDEVDRIIRKRIRIPSYPTWRRKELKWRKELEEFQRPEHWGLRPDSALAREVRLPASSRVLVAGPSGGNTALYLAAQGCSVTAVDASNDDDVPAKPNEIKKLPGKIDAQKVPLKEWSPVESLHAVVCTSAAFAGLNAQERLSVIEVLQSATQDGGVHLVDMIIAGGAAEPTLTELRKSYKGWKISIVDDGMKSRSFLARKAVA